MSFVQLVRKDYKGILEERYGIANIDDLKDLEVIEKIAEVRGCKLKGNEPDIEKASGILIDDFRSGRLGRISLETP